MAVFRASFPNCCLRCATGRQVTVKNRICASIEVPPRARRCREARKAAIKRLLNGNACAAAVFNDRPRSMPEIAQFDDQLQTVSNLTTETPRQRGWRFSGEFIPLRPSKSRYVPHARLLQNLLSAHTLCTCTRSARSPRRSSPITRPPSAGGARRLRAGKACDRAVG